MSIAHACHVHMLMHVMRASASPLMSLSSSFSVAAKISAVLEALDQAKHAFTMSTSTSQTS